VVDLKIFFFGICIYFSQGCIHAYTFDASGRLTIAAEERSKLQHEKTILQMKADYERLVQDWDCVAKQQQTRDHTGWLAFIPIALLIKMSVQLWQEELSLEDIGTFLATKGVVYVTEGAVWAAKKFQKLPPAQSDEKSICHDQRACRKVLNDFKVKLIESKLQLATVGLPLSSEEKVLVTSLEKAAADFSAKIEACDILNSVKKPGEIH
jgi:hypothetical protein